jgi:sigma-B regulation protein RsbU (phosphoserine phosphatase)
MAFPIIADSTHLLENFEDFFEHSLSGFLIADSRQVIVRANAKLCEWIGCASEQVIEKKFSDLLSIGSKIYYETHLSPLLRMQGFFDEVVLELTDADGKKFKVMVNAIERWDKDNKPLFFRYTILKATDRLSFEQNLLIEKKAAEKEALLQAESVLLREQLIAVLGHDLRNPLAAVNMATQMLKSSALKQEDSELISILDRSSRRMTELVNNIMDFARTRLGDGIVLEISAVDINALLTQSIEELQITHPKKQINLTGYLGATINCDASRLSQLVSNLIANALMHGSSTDPVIVDASLKDNVFIISVSNKGEEIPAAVQQGLFVPFAREVGHRPGQGLGLGLYIASEIARAHAGTLNFVSGIQGTCFTFSMPAGV